VNPRTLVWSLVTILVVAVASLGATFAAGKTPLLGLDLKGGVEVVLQPESKNTSSTTLAEAVNIIDNRVNGYGISNAQVTKQGNDIVIELPGAKNDTQILAELGQTAQLFFRPVECIIAPFVRASSAAAKAPSKTTTATTAPAHKAAAAAGSAGVAGSARERHPAQFDLVVRKAAFAAFTAVAQQARLDLAVHRASSAPKVAAGAKASPAAAKSATTTVPSTTTTTTLSQHVCGMTAAQQEAYVPPHGNAHGLTPPAWDDKHATVVLPYYSDFNKKGQYTLGDRYVLGPAQMTGEIVKTATAAINTSNDEWEVDLTFTGKGSTEFNNYAAAYYSCYKEDPSNPPFAVQCPPYGALQAVELDGVVESAPAIEASSFNGAATISGSTSNPFTAQEAQSLANALNYGSLPVRLVTQTISNVSPTIGTQSLRAGAVAGAVAVLLVIVYLVAYYRALGLVVVLGICMSGALLYAITTLLSATSGLALTLSGVIGLIVSVGVTADSCVVYFERLKEEIRSGRTVRTSVERGFSRAFRTILAADFSSFIGALILYALTVGDVRGFAFFLGLATLLNVVTTYFFTRPLVILVGRRSVGEGGALGVGRGLGAGRRVLQAGSLGAGGVGGGS
jgi:preprotein translocase subunit SecD